MATAQNNLLCYKGEAVQFQFTQKLAGVAEDITGWTIVFTLKLKATDATAKITASGVIDVAANGTYHIALSTTDTNKAAGAYSYDIWRTDAGSEAILSIGTFVIQQDVRL